VDRFSSFINYILTLSLDKVFLEDIWEYNIEGGECIIQDLIGHL
jgi:hypothetical protein